MTQLMHAGMSKAQALAQIDNLAQSQSVMLGTDQMFFVVAIAFVVAASVVWLAPKPKLFAGQMGGGH